MVFKECEALHTEHGAIGDAPQRTQCAPEDEPQHGAYVVVTSTALAAE